MRRCLGVGHGHHDRERRAVGRGGEPLLPVDHIVVTVGDGGRPHHHRVRTGHLRLGHREAAADLALDQRAQESLALLVGGVDVEDLDVAGVGGLGPEHQVAERAAPERLAQQAVLDHAEPQPAVLHRVVRRPEAHLANLDLGLGHLAGERVGGPVEHLALQRDDLLPDELVDHHEDGRHLLRQLEIHGARLTRHRGATPPSSPGRLRTKKVGLAVGVAYPRHRPGRRPARRRRLDVVQ